MSTVVLIKTRYLCNHAIIYTGPEVYCFIIDFPLKSVNILIDTNHNINHTIKLCPRKISFFYIRGGLKLPGPQKLFEPFLDPVLLYAFVIEIPAAAG